MPAVPDSGIEVSSWKIGAAVGLHPNYAMNLFKKVFATTLTEYLTQQRLSHAQRLEREGWLARYPTLLGEGSLLVATRAGVAVAEVEVPVARPPAPTWWAHLRACAWTAAWLTARGRAIQGPREIEADESWTGQIRWRDRRGQRTTGHRPDVAWLAPGGRVAIEVELTRKSTARLCGILELHRRWQTTGQSAGVIYICAHEHMRQRIIQLAGEQDLRTGSGGSLRVDLLETIRRQAIAARRRDDTPLAEPESLLRAHEREGG